MTAFMLTLCFVVPMWYLEFLALFHHFSTKEFTVVVAVIESQKLPQELFYKKGDS